MRQEQRFALFAADAGIIEIDMDERLAARLVVQRLFLHTDEERTTPLHGGHVPGRPATLAEEQVLSAVEAQQDDRMVFALLVLPEEDRIFALRLLELGGKDQHLIYVVTERRAPARGELQVMMLVVAQQYAVSHLFFQNAAGGSA